ncbi:MAG: ABC transporter permease subunit [Clostridia bacterium]|nr:ABC transporter permease subunit [Clostridia bacterium]MBQ9847485.1 ABC transporter permease subunit [Clostridia bacterium]
MLAIYMRELKSYFLTPIGYVFCGMFLVVSGLAFSECTLMRQSTTSIGEYFVWMMMIFAILIPILTMKLFSEDRKSRTDQILLTSPVSILGIVMGKYLAALTVFGVTFIVNSFNFVLLFFYGTPNATSILMNVLGIFLLGAAFLAIGIFLSSLTENQLIAAVSAIGVNAAMLIISLFSSGIENSFFRTVLKWFSVIDRFTPFTYQMLDVSAIVYYLSLAAVFIFLTTRVIEKRRWA